MIYAVLAGLKVLVCKSDGSEGSLSVGVDNRLDLLTGVVVKVGNVARFIDVFVAAG